MKNNFQFESILKNANGDNKAFPKSVSYTHLHERSRFAICFVYIRRIDLVNNILKKELDEWQGATGDRIMSTASQVIWMNCKDELKKSVYHREGQNTFCP